MNVTGESRKRILRLIEQYAPRVKDAISETEFSDAAIGPNGEVVVWVWVTPTVAEKFLEANSENNRRYMQTLAAKYSQDLSQNQWITTHEGLAFGAKGTLDDGQHRCRGVKRSGCSQWFQVTFNLDSRAIEVMNRGKVRTMAHALQSLGYEFSDHRTIATARAMIACPVYREWVNNLTQTSLRRFIDKNLEAIIYSRKVGSKDGPASFAAVVAKAYYYVPTTELDRFLEAFRDNIPIEGSEARDVTPRKLKAWLGKLNSTSGSGARLDIYCVCQNMLSAYLAGTIRKAIDSTGCDLYPLPNERNLDLSSEETASK